jgi:hypothetical protein
MNQDEEPSPEPRIFPPGRRERARLEGRAPDSPSRILSMEDIKRGLSDMAENGEGAQRAQAYRMLMNMESATVTLHEPMTVVDELAHGTRFFKALGKEKCQVCFRRAFPRDKKEINDTDKFSIDDMPAHIRAEAEKYTTQKKLRVLMGKNAPPSGVLKGFPTFQSPLKKSRFCQHQAALILLERWRTEGGTDAPTQAP